MDLQSVDPVRDMLVEQMDFISRLVHSLSTCSATDAFFIADLSKYNEFLCECAKQITLRDLAACESLRERKQKEAAETWLNANRLEALK